MKYTSSGCLFAFVVWIIILIILSQAIINHTKVPWSLNLKTLFEPIITGSAPPAVRFYAGCDIAIFTILTPENITNTTPTSTDQVNNGTCNQSSSPTPDMKALLGHITMRYYAAGEQIDSSDLGPRISFKSPFEVREIVVDSATTWIEPGDTMNFFLIEVPCSASSQIATRGTPTFATTGPVFGCVSTPLATAKPYVLVNTTILRLGTPGGGGLIPYLVAIPTDKVDNNQGAIALLDSNAEMTIAYPEFNAVPTEATATP
jgi:hypothetical protein